MSEHITNPMPPSPVSGASRPWRFWPDTRSGRALVVISSLAFIAYLGAVMQIRFEPMWDPWACDGDQPQAVWHYWRYKVDGAFPPGDLMTDYAFVMHAPPVWWALMASLSAITGPLWAAKVWNLVAYVLTVVAMWLGVTLRSNHFVGLAAAFLLVRSQDFFGLIAGGYARSFGPLLVVAFLAAFYVKRHWLVLGILVLQAAFYPSVVMPCGAAYGIYVVVAGPMRDRLRRMASMFVAGLLIIGFGKYQEIGAPDWWGSVVTLDEALEMPAWQRGGRIHEAPLRPIELEVRRNLQRAHRRAGVEVLPPVADAWEKTGIPGVAAVVLAGALLYTAVWWRARRRGRTLEDAFPWQLPLLLLGAFLAYLLARMLAFKLYLPYRSLQHTVPYVMYASLPLLVWTLFVNTLGARPTHPTRNRLASAGLTLLLSTLPVFLVFGTGYARTNQSYYSNRGYRELFGHVRTLPLDAQIAGQISIVDRIPLFTWHRVNVTKNLAHPFRPGYYEETERRLRASYTALYASDLETVLQVSRDEKIDYWVWDTRIFAKLDIKLFEPIRRDMAKLFRKNKPGGFALERVPPSALVFSRGTQRILSVAALESAMRSAEASSEQAANPTPLEDVPAPEGEAEDLEREAEP